jgi:predicted transposase YdaD
MKTSPFLDQFRAEGRREGREEGRLEGARALLLRVGQKKFGKAPTKKQQNELAAITSLRRLKRLSVRLLDVDSWDELLAPR